MTTAFIGVGSNVGDRERFCREAIAALGEADAIRVDKVSSLYETAPIGGPPQRSFINLVVRVETELDPRALLVACQQIEQQMGREPSDIKWGPRVVDLDLLTFGEEKVSEPDLEIPHPRMKERCFVLVPLLEIEPDAADPWGSRYADALDEAEGDVELLGPF
ncbi:MAG: 2-amino-4-hydroxy-6-hydroxymethyldihydropteridine diphosphokinase [Actinomycetota bacterium]|nr:2-amino-4-hydroxy-6-hydroxymethyldihydropteridine diphosphokinase [Actinomycetota bacterium]